jgi:predicted MFS family arabinose efflux permease
VIGYLFEPMENEDGRINEPPKREWGRTFLGVAAAMYAIYLITLLYCASALRTTHRNFLSIVQAPIQRELKVSDELFGSITGPIFSFSHAVAGLFFGRMIDTYPRKIILIIMIVSWTTFNCLHGLITKPWHLVLVRIGLAVSMAGVPSCALSLIGDLVSKQRRAISIAFYNSSFVLAVSGPYLFGLLLNDKSSNWRTIFFYMGIPGIALTLLAFLTFTEPERGSFENVKIRVVSVWETVKFLGKSPSMWFICLTAGFSFMAANATNVWGPAFYLRVHGMPVKELSTWLVWISPVAGIIGTFSGGWFADQLQKWTPRGYAIICLIAVVVGTPLQFLVFLLPNAIGSILVSFPSLLVGFMIVPILYLIPIQIVPASMRASAVSWLMVFI